MSRHFKKSDTFEAFHSKNVGESAPPTAGPSPSGGAPNGGAAGSSGQGAWRAEGSRRLQLKDTARIIRAVIEWGRDRHRQPASSTERQFMKHAKFRAFALLGFGCVWAYFNPEHSYLSRQWHAYREGQHKALEAHSLEKAINTDGAVVKILSMDDTKNKK